jgi:tRNA nucleotidyltransferase/poly(A) polymerase
MTNNIRIFEVGGSIRDELMGIDNPPDRDFCAESPAGWEALLGWCEEHMDKVFLVTPEFFTVRGRIGKDTIDIVMCRIDGSSSDGRHPDHVEIGTLMDDLARRDFTMNAMAREVNPRTLKPIGEIIDPFGGAFDAEEGVLKCVGDTVERLEEDGLRLLRAARFAITKDLIPNDDLELALQDETWWAFVERSVSEERIREELSKMFKHDTAATLRFLFHHCSSCAVDFLFGDTTNVWLKPTTEKKKK